MMRLWKMKSIRRRRKEGVRMDTAARKFRKSILFTAKFLLLAVLFGILMFFWWKGYPEATYWRGGNYVVMVFYATLLVVFVSLYGGTRIGILRLGEIIYSYLVALVLTNLLMYLQFCLSARALLNPWPILAATLIQLAAAAAGAKRINTLYFRLYPAREVVVIYSHRDHAIQIIKKMTRVKERYHVCIALHEDEPFERIRAALDRYGSVLLCDVEPVLANRLFSYCSLNSKRVYLVPDFQDVLIRTSHSTQLFDTPVFYCKNAEPSTEQLMMKRCMDVGISAVALVVFSPIMLLIAAAIKLCDRGPVLYRQKRLTRGGKVFTLYKFRSMVCDAERGGARLSSKNDDRVTPVGRVIRGLRLDELPQLFNILWGEMSVVGPRPERPEIAREYEEALPEFALRLRMKAGLTGYAQVYGRYNTTMRDKLLLDLLYIENYSILMDLRMLFMTVKILFMPESTEGIEEGARLPEEPGES